MGLGFGVSVYRTFRTRTLYFLFYAFNSPKNAIKSWWKKLLSVQSSVLRVWIRFWNIKSLGPESSEFSFLEFRGFRVRNFWVRSTTNTPKKPHKIRSFPGWNNFSRISIGSVSKWGGDIPIPHSSHCLHLYISCLTPDPFSIKPLMTATDSINLSKKWGNYQFFFSGKSGKPNHHLVSLYCYQLLPRKRGELSTNHHARAFVGIVVYRILITILKCEPTVHPCHYKEWVMNEQHGSHKNWVYEHIAP